GGGTFDISILELNNGVFNVRSTNGDTHLGGEDFDHKILDYISESFLAENDIDLRKDSMALQRVKEAAERAKHELSSSLETDINIPFIAANATGPKHLDISLTRSKIEELCLDLVERTIPPCEQALTDAGVSKDDIDDILLVGGMTRMPMVQKTVEGFFGKSGNKEVNPDEVVAIGASIQGAVLSGDIKNVILLDVTPLSLGVETAGGVFTPLIARNTTVPCKKMQVFSTALDNQPLVDIHILQGERQMAADNQKLANFELVGIPPAPRGVPQIEVSFEIDTNGIVKVSAKDLGTGKNQSMRITAQSGLSEEEVAALIQDAQNFKNEDELKRRLADAKNNAKGLIYSTKRTLDEYGDVLEAIDQDLIKTDLKKLEEALEEEDAQIIEESYKLLEESAYRIAEVLYQQGDS
ncbi:Hsp70 family protein, partial [Myxococcota bacterium]|nr:Hsp70 family protein [Myxococcota bacterium]